VIKSAKPSAFVTSLVQLAQVAGREIMNIYGTDFSAKAKSDLTPVTEADERAERVILAGLAAAWPDIPVISEEAASAGHIPEVSNRFFLVDPLDGTKEFISRNGEFTVNIALIENGTSTHGVVFAPALSRLFWGEVGHGAAQAKVSVDDSSTKIQWQALAVRSLPTEGATVVASRSHRDAATESYLARQKVKSIVAAGSSLKFCIIAAGEADLYPRFGRTMEWDTAAGHAVLSAAGGKVICEDGEHLAYGKNHRGFDNPAFIASA
jgi:3'(2'), 5'-bisphosphate nucleotidase